MNRKNMTMNNQKLHQPGDNSIFKVPDNYFENFSAIMGSRIDAFETEKNSVVEQESNQSTTKKGLLVYINQYKHIMYMASMFVLMLFSIGMIMHYTSDDSASYNSQATQKNRPVPTAEDYLINTLGTYSISQYYIESELSD